MKNALDSQVSALMDVLRGVSALIVAFTHSFQIFCLPYFGLYGAPHLFTSWLASYAVVTFFVVSGFMIRLSVANHLGEAGFRVGSFFRARLLRIYPPLVASLAICVGVFVLMNSFDIHGAESFRLGSELFLSREKVDIEWERFIPTLLLIYNIVPGSTPSLSINGPLWTLSYEWWFYLFVMLAVHAGTNKTSPLRYLPILLVLVLFMWSPAGRLLWIFSLIWGGGYLLAHLYKNGKLLQARSGRLLGLSIAVCILGIITVGGGKTLSYLVEPLQRHGAQGDMTMMFVGFILTALIGLMIKGRIRVRILSGSARYSYTLYLIHFPLQLLAFGLLHQRLSTQHWSLSLAAGIAVTLLIVALAAQVAKVVENRELINQALKRWKI